MKSSIEEYDHLAQKVCELNLDQIFKDAVKLSSNCQPKVILLSCSDLKTEVGPFLSNTIVICESAHEFFRLGLNQEATVIVVGAKRAECSTIHLNQLLSSRIKKPFALITKDQKSIEELLNEIKNASQKIQKLVSIENLIDYNARKIVTECSTHLTPSGIKNEANRLQEFKFSRNLLRSRTRKLINEKPEDFLSDAISQIRKTAEM